MYFDPGTGSLIVQLVLACTAGLASFFVLFKTSIKNFFSKFGKKKEKKDDVKK